MRGPPRSVTEALHGRVMQLYNICGFAGFLLGLSNNAQLNDRSSEVVFGFKKS